MSHIKHSKVKKAGGLRFKSTGGELEIRKRTGRGTGIGGGVGRDAVKVSIKMKKHTIEPSGSISEIHPPDLMKATMKFGKKNLQITKFSKTKVGNRKILLYGVDERDFRVRRARELYYGILEDLGGVEQVTTIQDMTAKHLAFLYVMSEEKLQQWLEKSDIFDSVVYMAFVKVAGQQARLLGVKRVKKQVGPDQTPETLDDFLRQQELKWIRKMREKHGKFVDADYKIVASPDEPRKKTKKIKKKKRKDH